jgi:hypothetical protein
MIKLQDLTPEIYYKQSRDFQFIGRLYDVVLNYIKTNAANLYNLPSGQNMDEQLLNLLALTLGLKTTKQYNSKQLRAICGVLPTILKYKGSIQALVLATNALLQAEGVKQPLDYTLVPKQGITLYVAQELNDLTLFTDLLDYLLPAGLSCTIVKESQSVHEITTIIGVQDYIKINQVDDSNRYIGSTSWSESDVLDGNLLSTIASNRAPQKLKDLSLGDVGISPSILSNILVTFPHEHETQITNTSEGGIEDNENI